MVRNKVLPGLFVIAAAVNTASAAVTDWGVHGNLEAGSFFVAPGAFSDTVLFNLPTINDVTSVTVANNNLNVLNIQNGQVSLFREAGAVDTLIGSYAFNGTTGSTPHPQLGLTAGDYYYQITGTANGSDGGLYTISSVLGGGAIPEPTGAMLVLGGIGALSIIRRR